jgi:hypothetical protein
VSAFFLLVSGLATASARPTLRPGEALFWSGPRIDTSSGEEFVFRFDIRSDAYRLRIGADHPEVGDSFGITISGPDAFTTFVLGPGIYSEERTFTFPERGQWRVTVRADDVTDSSFRVRAMLEAREPSLGVKKGPVLPNLQVLPPHQASFLLPLTNGTNDLDPTGVDVGGQGGCHAEEHAEDHAVRCLRFGFGVRNTGLGPMDLTHRGSSPLEHDLFQNIFLVGGSYRERVAGKAVYHKTHGHFHHDAAVGLRMFQVSDKAKGKLTAAGEMRTKGFAHRNELLRDWEHFYPTIEIRGFGLKPGWADIYEWDRPGNYIDFGLNPDGYYVVRMWVDPDNGIVESNEDDNMGYAYMKVTGSEVKLLEVGRGSDPWDRCKIEVGLGGHPDPVHRSRPADCAPDTT